MGALLAASYPAKADEPDGWSTYNRNPIQPYGKPFIIEGVSLREGANDTTLMKIEKGWQDDWPRPFWDRFWTFFGYKMDKVAYYRISPNVRKNGTVGDCRLGSLYHRRRAVVRLAHMWHKDTKREITDRPVLWFDQESFADEALEKACQAQFQKTTSSN